MVDFLIITGLSGAGGTQAANTFEDLGWFVIDNLPPDLISKVAELVQSPASTVERVALVVRTNPYLDELTPALDGLRNKGARVRIVFLEASDDVLVRRYENTRRRHPIADERVLEGIERERKLLEPVKGQADVILDTTNLNVHQLRDRLLELFARQEDDLPLQTNVVSFGYKHGPPLDVDMVLDCRFLPNPHWVDELRPFTGLDEPVREYVMSQPETGEFLKRLDDLFSLLLPGFVKEGKSYLTVAVGCTGGNHRSVVIAEELAKILANHGFDPTVHHRDVNRR